VVLFFFSNIPFSSFMVIPPPHPRCPPPSPLSNETIDPSSIHNRPTFASVSDGEDFNQDSAAATGSKDEQGFIRPVQFDDDVSDVEEDPMFQNPNRQGPKYEESSSEDSDSEDSD